MKLRAVHEEKLYTYEENIWTGKKQLSINGVKCTKMDKKSFVDPETRELLTIKGSLITNISITKKSGTYYLVKNSPFDWLFICLSFAVMVMALVLLSGVLGGGLGGVLAIFAASFNTSILRSKLNKVVKAIICLAITLASCVAWWLIYTFVVVLIFV